MDDGMRELPIPSSCSGTYRSRHGNGTNWERNTDHQGQLEPDEKWYVRYRAWHIFYVSIRLPHHWWLCCQFDVLNCFIGVRPFVIGLSQIYSFSPNLCICILLQILLNWGCFVTVLLRHPFEPLHAYHWNKITQLTINFQYFIGISYYTIRVSKYVVDNILSESIFCYDHVSDDPWHVVIRL